MIGFLVLGLFFLLVDHRRLLFASFISCGLLCLFLKNTSNQHLRLPQNTGSPSFSIAHFNLANSSMDYLELMNYIIDVNADVVSFNEVTPDWDQYLDEVLGEHYRHHAELIRIDPMGLAIYSKMPLLDVDTLRKQSHSHLLAAISLGLRKRLNVVASYFLPPLTRKAYGDYRADLVHLSEALQSVKGSVINVGDFNLYDWSNELREFKNLTQLQSSRRDVSPSNIQGIKSLINFPVDHVFYSNELECNSFKEINDSIGNHLGIWANIN